MKRRKEIEEAGGLRAESNSDKIRRNETFGGQNNGRTGDGAGYDERGRHVRSAADAAGALSRRRSGVFMYEHRRPVKRTENIERAFAWGAAQVKAVLAPYETLFDAAIYEKTGPEAMICVRAEAKAVKKRLCALEDGEELGRLLDIDVIAPDGGKISRTDIGLPARALSALRQARARLREKPRAQRGRAL